MTAPTTVLIVDDEPRSLEAIQRVLADEFEVICAANAAQAEARAQRAFGNRFA